jgi:osmotically-inducible protein OsmY
MSSDSQIKHQVERELLDCPTLSHPEDIAVTVKDGVVTLTGFVPAELDDRAAVQVARYVSGVAAVADELIVRQATGAEWTDPELSEAAATLLKEELPIASETIKLVVRNGTILLEGEVDWNYQNERSQEILGGLAGVKHIENRIRVRPHVNPAELRRKIQEAIVRSAERDAHRIEVSSNGDTVTLTGTVRSWAEREEAERTARMNPGVTAVDNWIVIAP